jgi:LysR family transcriptional regulator, low CO2-responsive transcriptional regulator
MKAKLNLAAVTLRQLRVFTAVVEEGSVSRAAARVHVTPPAVSLQLRQLEELAGLPLVERRPKGFAPTDAGRELLAAARQIDRALAESADAIGALRDGEAGRIALGVISTAKYFAPRAVAAFKRLHPRTEIRLLVGNREDMLAALEGYELDLAITGRPPQAFPVDQDAIGDHPHVIVAPPDSPLTARRGLRLADLADQSFLLRERGSGTRILVRELMQDAGLDPDLGMEVGSNETIKQAVIAGLGIALISAHTVAYEVQDGRLAVLDVEGLPIVRQWFVVKRRDKRLLPAAAMLWAFLVTHGKEHLPRLTIP